MNIHSEMQIDCRKNLFNKVGKLKTHGRYLVIDNIEVYHSDHCFGQLGEASSSIMRMRELNKKNEVLIDLKSQFDTAEKIDLNA